MHPDDLRGIFKIKGEEMSKVHLRAIGRLQNEINQLGLINADLLKVCKAGLRELQQVSSMAGSINYDIIKQMIMAIVKAEG